MHKFVQALLYSGFLQLHATMVQVLQYMGEQIRMLFFAQSAATQDLFDLILRTSLWPTATSYFDGGLPNWAEMSHPAKLGEDCVYVVEDVLLARSASPVSHPLVLANVKGWMAGL
ncbi:hypothetical protein K438DRAFT_1773323 [Mycena galopus ATCC 62051]|nr:hypothetical protein K438DRAFT_1773323 [Mycena galopus ATCC 62051]